MSLILLLIQPAIVLVNTGPHWEPDRFKPITESQMMEAYKLVVNTHPSANISSLNPL
jgi:hypothetical protein